MKETVLVTGSAGRVARLVAPRLREEFRLRRLDVVPQSPQGDDELVEADARDVDAVRSACAAVKAVIHLAGQPAEADFRTVLLPKNLDATWAVYEAAVLAGVPRFVFASTVQTVEGSGPGVAVGPDDPPRPISLYGCTKLFGEALGRFHADRSELGVACLRLGAVRAPDDPGLAAGGSIRDLWVGADDLAALMIAAVRSEVRFATVIAVSPPATTRFDTANPFDWTPTQRPTTGSQDSGPRLICRGYASLLVDDQRRDNSAFAAVLVSRFASAIDQIDAGGTRRRVQGCLSV